MGQGCWHGRRLRNPSAGDGEEGEVVVFALLLFALFITLDIAFWWAAFARKNALHQKWWVSWIPGSGFWLYLVTRKNGPS